MQWLAEHSNAPGAGHAPQVAPHPSGGTHSAGSVRGWMSDCQHGSSSYVRTLMASAHVQHASESVAIKQSAVLVQ
jgi:hypothetical protein